ncbi:TolC family protein [Bacteroides caecimuris]|jgi:outer membrane protein TolC|uniref:Transporter n=1 Tax=Bacteroides caecimuris TaxID=1796613 RepID=A0A1C7H392_9BACE|nr:TolC family protein [Bacteroides caecimuris]ANU58280.1 transporter [Bacteroides caecimuris]OXE65530.1 TolC family protein [Bacteroides caecimuris]QQR16824.1 TolC family protein [Bacteroides caecimuris]UQA29810.1 TolC family protein [Bacteroides caecimuris]
MKTQLITLSLLLLGLTAEAQQPSLSRETYRNKVEAYSQILKQQKLKTMASTEARKIAHTGFLPKIDVNADGTLNMSDLNAWNEPVGEYRNHTYQGVFIVSQPLYMGGALNAQHKIAQADERLNQLNEELTIDQIHYQSDAVYWNASASQAMLQAADKYQNIVKQQHDIIQDRFNDGMISRTDLLMISTRLKEAELQYIKARQNYTLALQKLNILMGEEPNNPVDSLYTIDAASAPVQILSLENVLQRRADYESTEVNIMKSQAQRKAALSQFNPQLNMYFSGGWATATPNLGYDVSFNPIVGINLNIPIFRWGARFKTNRQQKAYISIQKLQQSYVADNINEELSAALTKLTETEYQVKTAKETMNLANENLDLVSFSYNEGKANMVDVLSAQLSWTQAYTNLINAYLSEKMAVAEYRKVISE